MDKQLQLAMRDYAGTREMLRRARVLGISESKSFSVVVVGEAFASISRLWISCKQPDGTRKTFDILAGQAPSAVPGVGNLIFFGLDQGYVFLAAMNVGALEGALYLNVIDDTRKVLYYKSGTIAVGSELVNDTTITFDMPNRSYTLTVEVGHL